MLSFTCHIDQYPELDSIMDLVAEYYKPILEAKVKQAEDMAWKDWLVYVDDQVQEIFKNAVDQFYGEYAPSTYGRTGSMYRLLMTDSSSDAFRYWFEPGNMIKYERGQGGEDGNYNYAFREGWHGGAASGPKHPSPGTPYYRIPYPRYYRWDTYPGYVGTPPLTIFKDDLSSKAGERNDKWNSLRESYINKLLG